MEGNLLIGALFSYMCLLSGQTFYVSIHSPIKCTNRKQNDCLGDLKDTARLNSFTIVKGQKDYSGVLLLHKVCEPKLKRTIIMGYIFEDELIF